MVLVPYEHELSYTRQSELDKQMSGILKRTDLNDRHKYQMYQKLLEAFLRIKNPVNNISQTEPVVTVDANVDTKDLTQMVDVSTGTKWGKKRNMAVDTSELNYPTNKTTQVDFSTWANADTNALNTPIKKSSKDIIAELNDSNTMTDNSFYRKLLGDETLNDEKINKSLMNQSLVEPVTKPDNESFNIPLNILTPDRTNLSNSSQLNYSKLDNTPSYASAVIKKPLLNQVLTAQHNKSTNLTPKQSSIAATPKTGSKTASPKQRSFSSSITTTPKTSSFSSSSAPQIKKSFSNTKTALPPPLTRIPPINKATIPSKIISNSNSTGTQNSPNVSEDGFITQRGKKGKIKSWETVR